MARLARAGLDAEASTPASAAGSLARALACSSLGGGAGPAEKGTTCLARREG